MRLRRCFLDARRGRPDDPWPQVRDVVPHSGATLFVVDPTKLDARRGAAVSLHYKVECAAGVVVKSSPKATLRDGSRPRSFGVKGKWTCVEVALVKDGWLKLSRGEVDAYRGTHTYAALAEERGGDEFVERRAARRSRFRGESRVLRQLLTRVEENVSR